ncbi:hypothetical protein HK405_004663, partial [Cladochytrium tenue]
MDVWHDARGLTLADAISDCETSPGPFDASPGPFDASPSPLPLPLPQLGDRGLLLCESIDDIERDNVKAASPPPPPSVGSAPSASPSSPTGLGRRSNLKNGYVVDHYSGQIPEGYVLVPRGNNRLTNACRSKALAAGTVVYLLARKGQERALAAGTVVYLLARKGQERDGILVPREVYDKVACAFDDFVQPQADLAVESPPVGAAVAADGHDAAAPKRRRRHKANAARGIAKIPLRLRRSMAIKLSAMGASPAADQLSLTPDAIDSLAAASAPPATSWDSALAHGGTLSISSRDYAGSAAAGDACRDALVRDQHGVAVDAGQHADDALFGLVESGLDPLSLGFAADHDDPSTMQSLYPFAAFEDHASSPYSLISPDPPLPLPLLPQTRSSSSSHEDASAAALVGDLDPSAAAFAADLYSAIDLDFAGAALQFQHHGHVDAADLLLGSLDPAAGAAAAADFDGSAALSNHHNYFVYPPQQGSSPMSLDDCFVQPTPPTTHSKSALPSDLDHYQHQQRRYPDAVAQTTASGAAGAREHDAVLPPRRQLDPYHDMISQATELQRVTAFTAAAAAAAAASPPPSSPLAAMFLPIRAPPLPHVASGAGDDSPTASPEHGQSPAPPLPQQPPAEAPFHHQYQLPPPPPMMLPPHPQLPARHGGASPHTGHPRLAFPPPPPTQAASGIAHIHHRHPNMQPSHLQPELQYRHPKSHHPHHQPTHRPAPYPAPH